MEPVERQAWLLTRAQRRSRGWKGLSAVTARVGEKVSGNECPPHGAFGLTHPGRISPGYPEGLITTCHEELPHLE